MVAKPASAARSSRAAASPSAAEVAQDPGQAGLERGDARGLGHRALQQLDDLRRAALLGAQRADLRDVDDDAVGLAGALAQPGGGLGQAVGLAQVAAQLREARRVVGGVPAQPRLAELVAARQELAPTPRPPAPGEPGLGGGVDRAVQRPDARQRVVDAVGQRASSPRPCARGPRACRPTRRRGSGRAGRRGGSGRPAPGGRARAPRRPARGAARGRGRTAAPSPAAPAAARSAPGPSARRARSRAPARPAARASTAPNALAKPRLLASAARAARSASPQLGRQARQPAAASRGTAARAAWRCASPSPIIRSQRSASPASGARSSSSSAWANQRTAWSGASSASARSPARRV